MFDTQHVLQKIEHVLEPQSYEKKISVLFHRNSGRRGGGRAEMIYPSSLQLYFKKHLPRSVNPMNHFVTPGIKLVKLPMVSLALNSYIP